jgi:hypothetical protein
MGYMTGTFSMPEFNSSHKITHRNFVRIGDKKFFSKKPWTPPTFYRICTRKKHLNGHSSFIKHNMWMSSTPLDSSFQALLSSRKNFTSIFSFKRNSQKNEKTQIFRFFWLPHQQMGYMTGTLSMPEFNSSHKITHRNFVRIGDKKNFRKNHEPLPSIEVAPRKNI